MKLSNLFRTFMSDEAGLETVEYAIILGLIVAGTIGLIVGIGDWVNDAFQTTSDEIGA